MLLAGLLCLLSYKVSANEHTIYFKKLVDSTAKSVMILGCQTPRMNSCRVLGGGSISQKEVIEMHRKLLSTHRLEGAGIIALSTLSTVINPMIIASFMTVPATAITLVGSSAYVYFKHEDFESYKKMQLFSGNQNFVLTSSQTIEAMDQTILELRN